MKTFCTLFAAFYLFAACVHAQSSGHSPDTLLQHTFEGILDPADTMLLQPSGNDVHWVNYDQDNKTGGCVSNGPTPKGWYWESDLSFIDPNAANNFALTSCSYLLNGNPQNRNWLITSPIEVPDDTYWLRWRSLSYYGPDFMDGYRVLVSTTTNFPANFTDTLFSAAQTIQRLVVGSLDVNDYVFSEGYIHANAYTDDDYFFVDFENDQPFYHGKLEPHSVSLSAYSGQKIYVAFLHDSFDDFQLQVDDILVTNQTSATTDFSNLLSFNILPNPAHDFSWVGWNTLTPEAGRLQVLDAKGKRVWEKSFAACTEGQMQLDLQGLQPGVYFCRLETSTGFATKRLIKM